MKQFKNLEIAYLKKGTPVFFTEWQDEFLLAKDHWMIVTTHSMNTVFGVLGGRAGTLPDFWCDREVSEYVKDNPKTIRIKEVENVLMWDEYQKD